MTKTNKPNLIDARIIATTTCPTCGSEPGKRCQTIRAKGGMGFQFNTATHKPRVRAAAREKRP